MATKRRPKSTKPRTTTKRGVRPDDLLQFNIVSDAQISPDGENIVFVKKHISGKNEYLTNLWMVNADGRAEARQFTSGGKDRHPRWSRDGKRIAFIGGREKTRPQLYIINPAGGEATALTSLPEGSIGTFCWSPDGRMIAASFREQHPDWTEEAKKARQEKGLSDPPRVIDDWWYRLDGDGYFIAQRHHLYLVDTETGKHRVVYAKDAMGHFSFDFSPDSKRLVIASNRDKKAMIKPWRTELLVLNLASGKLASIPNLPAGPKEKVQWSPDGKLIAFAGREGMDDQYSTENLELHVCDPIRGGTKNLTGSQDYCVMAVALSDSAEVAFEATFKWSPDSKRVFMQLGWHGASQIASVPARGGRIHFHTRGAAIHNLGGISADGKTIAMTVGHSTKLEEVHVAKIAPRLRPTALTDFNGPLLKQLALAKPESEWVTAADGWRTQLWVIKPPNLKRGKKCPAVLEVHGGPHAQYGVGYFHEFQCLASAGCVVIFSNPRGSKGYGRDHCAAIRGAWGGADWTDIQAVTKFMQRQPFINPKRMGVMGGSYGGYMTNWVIGHTNDFAAAITDRCVSNLVSMAGNSDFVDPPDRYWEGNFWNRPETRWNQSPIKYFGNAKTPTLIIHSEGDLRCNVEQSEQVFSALKLLNVETKFIRYPSSTSHGMSRGGPPDLRIHRLTHILDWWQGHL